MYRSSETREPNEGAWFTTAMRSSVGEKTTATTDDPKVRHTLRVLTSQTSPPDTAASLPSNEMANSAPNVAFVWSEPLNDPALSQKSTLPSPIREAKVDPSADAATETTESASVCTRRA